LRPVTLELNDEIDDGDRMDAEILEKAAGVQPNLYAKQAEGPG
jgi:hypothetical protein